MRAARERRQERIPGVEKPLSRVVLGTMVVDIRQKERSFALLDAAFNAGINTLDTAHVYAGGNSERGIGAWCTERGLREKLVILTKGCVPNADRKRITTHDLTSDLCDSLARLQTHYVDLYLFHRDDPAVPVGTIVDFINEHIAAGRIRAWGGSNWTRARLAAAVAYAKRHGAVPPVASSPHFGLATQVKSPWGPGCVTLTGDNRAADRNWYTQSQLATFAYSSLARGLFSGRTTRDNYLTTTDGACQRAYCHPVNFERLDRAHLMAKKRRVTVTQVALAFVLNSPMNTFALVGAENASEIAACVAAQHIQFSNKELCWLETGRR